MAKINQKEYEILKGLDDKWKWIARDRNGEIYKFLEEPIKVNDFNWKDPESTWLRMDRGNFQFIKWKDGAPYSIAELIEGYERYKKVSDYDGWKYTENRENTMDKKELKDEVTNKQKKVHERWLQFQWRDNSRNYFEGKKDAFSEVLDLIDQRDEKSREKTEVKQEIDGYLSCDWVNIDKNKLVFAKGVIDQLDEPEVLTPDWIKDNQVLYPGVHGVDYYVPADKLYGKIMPKQELPETPEKVVVPKWFAEWYETRGCNMNLYGAFKNLYTYYRQGMEKWSEQYETGHAELQEDLATIYKIGRNGYTVEEKKYCVKMGNVYYKRAFEFTAWKDKAWVFSEKGDAEEEARQLGGTVEEVSE